MEARRKVIGIGECVLDVIVNADGTATAVPGGSVLNAAMSMSRVGLDVTFVSVIGDDKPGRRITDALRSNGVDIACLRLTREAKTTVSVAFLDENRDADYLFLKEPMRIGSEHSLPAVNGNDIVLIGSFFAVDNDVRPMVKGLTEGALRSSALLYYDLNYRPSHLPQKPEVMANIRENIEAADIVRGSTDDFNIVFGTTDIDALRTAEPALRDCDIILTDGARPVTVASHDGFSATYITPEVQAVSTIGAGDNFNAGFIYGLMQLGITRERLLSGLSPEQWHTLTRFAGAFAAECCRSIENYVPAGFDASSAIAKQ